MALNLFVRLDRDYKVLKKGSPATVENRFKEGDDLPTLVSLWDSSSKVRFTFARIEKTILGRDQRKLGEVCADTNKVLWHVDPVYNAFTDCFLWMGQDETLLSSSKFLFEEPYPVSNSAHMDDQMLMYLAAATHSIVESIKKAMKPIVEVELRRVVVIHMLEERLRPRIFQALLEMVHILFQNPVDMAHVKKEHPMVYNYLVSNGLAGEEATATATQIDTIKYQPFPTQSQVHKPKQLISAVLRLVPTYIDSLLMRFVSEPEEKTFKAPFRLQALGSIMQDGHFHLGQGMVEDSTISSDYLKDNVAAFNLKSHLQVDGLHYAFHPAFIAMCLLPSAFGNPNQELMAKYNLVSANSGPVVIGPIDLGFEVLNHNPNTSAPSSPEKTRADTEDPLLGDDKHPPKGMRNPTLLTGKDLILTEASEVKSDGKGVEIYSDEEFDEDLSDTGFLDDEKSDNNTVIPDTFVHDEASPTKDTKVHCVGDQMKYLIQYMKHDENFDALMHALIDNHSSFLDPPDMSDDKWTIPSVQETLSATNYGVATETECARSKKQAKKRLRKLKRSAPTSTRSKDQS